MGDVIERAAELAKAAHEGQVRKVSGAPYFTHVESVASLVREYGGSDEMIAAAYLHDTLEDTEVEYSQLKSTFGQNVADMVEQLTNEKNIPKEEKAKYLIRKMKGMVPEVLFIKLCDILSNVRDNPSQMQLRNYNEVVTVVSMGDFTSQRVWGEESRDVAGKIKQVVKESEFFSE